MLNDNKEQKPLEIQDNFSQQEATLLNEYERKIVDKINIVEQSIDKAYKDNSEKVIILKKEK